MYAQLGTETREIIRTRRTMADQSAVWWCPFCDYSNQLRLDTPTGAARPCGKCGATVLLEKPAPVPDPNTDGAVRADVPVDSVSTPTDPPAPAPRPRGPGPVPRNQRGKRGKR